ncbi:type VII secretion protein EccE [Actinokineospora sp. G85]|uniref:type VII secretion protein EccE n=1 Tax=Actinokineospora sp. G85 TaxID=3406626 RepID=UPI003C70E9E1
MTTPNPNSGQVLGLAARAVPPSARRPAPRPAPPTRVASTSTRGHASQTAQAHAAPQGMAVRPAPADPRTRPIHMYGSPAPPRAAPLATTGAPRPPRGGVREYLRQLDAIQLVCWQLAALGVLLTARQPWPVLVCACAGAAAVLALTTVRVGGRWLYQVAVLAAGYLARPRRRDLPETAGKTPALLGLLAPGATVRTTETAHGPVMTVSHPGGLAAVLRPTGNPPAGLLGVLVLPAALVPAGDGHEHRFGVQTIAHVGVRRDGPPKVWFAVHAARTAENPRDEELTLVLRNALRRVRRALERAGVPAEPLAEDTAFTTIAGLAHVTGGRNEVREDWRYWRTGAVSQAAFALTGLDRLSDAQTRRLVADLFANTGGVAVTVAISARHTPRRGTRVAGVLRLAATTEAAVTAAAAAISTRTAPAGIRLTRMDGTHSTGVAASLPIGVS